MPLVLYAIVKWLTYILWCYAGIRLSHHQQLRAQRAVALGSARLGIGVFFGAIVFFSGVATQETAAMMYPLIYGPVRLVEWLIIAVIIFRWRGLASVKPWLWVVGGIAASFLADFASPEGISGHFCIGRCLC